MANLGIGQNEVNENADPMSADISEKLKTTMQQMRDEVDKSYASFVSASADISADAKAQVKSNIMQIVHATWSQIYQTEFNRKMARMSGAGGGLALPPSAF